MRVEKVDTRDRDVAIEIEFLGDIADVNARRPSHLT
jgi:hypothetical protein